MISPLGDYEEEQTTDGKTRKIHYLSGGNGLAAIFVEENSTAQLYYAYTDYLGSLTALTDKDGNIVERQAFDPWGNRRNPNDWTSLITTPVSHITGRGYTMHEHLDDFALINMNGRVYDPQIARFLSPDPQLQAPGYWLNYNRYGYCWNNPLIYTDPTGEFPWLFAIGAVIGSYIGGSAINDDWSPWNGGWDWSEPGTYFGIIGGALAGGLVIQSAFGAGGWLAGGQGLSVNIGAGFEGIQAFTQMTINSGIVTWEGLGYTTIAGGGMWLSSNYLKGEEPNGPFVDMTVVNQVRYEVQSQGGGPGWESYVGAAGTVASEMYYSEKYGTWMGKNFKIYQQTWGGNGATGGKLKFGKKVSTGIKIGGYGLGVWNAYEIDQQNRAGQITDGQMYIEQGSNLITTVGGLYGAAWGVGWELGRAVTNMEWYQKAKFNFWYNYWESQVGPPSQSNEALWYYFYQNYKP